MCSLLVATTTGSLRLPSPSLRENRAQPSITSLGSSNVGQPRGIYPRNNVARASEIYSAFSSLRGELNRTTVSTEYL